MGQQVIQTALGAADDAPIAGAKINANFNDLYSAGLAFDASARTLANSASVGATNAVTVATTAQTTANAATTNDQADQRLFESYLFNGPFVFHQDGSNDDAPALNYAINQIGSDGKFHSVRLPSGMKTILLNSNNSTFASSTLCTHGAMIQIPFNVGLDLNHCTLNAGNNTSVFGGSLCSAMILMFPNPASNGVINDYGGSYGYCQVVNLENGRLSSTTNFSGGFGTAALVIDNPNAGSATGGGSRFTIQNMFFDQCGHNMVALGNSTYLGRFLNCEFFGWFKGVTLAGAGYAIYNPTGTSNVDEHTRITDCEFYNGGVCLGSAAEELTLHGDSFDYNRMAIQLLGGAVGFPHAITGTCNHIELGLQNTHYDATAYYVDMGAQGAWNVNLFGGMVYVNPAAPWNTGNTITAIFNSGTAGVAAPFGMALLWINRTLNGATYYNAGATTHLVVDGVNVI